MTKKKRARNAAVVIERLLREYLDVAVGVITSDENGVHLDLTSAELLAEWMDEADTYEKLP